MALTHGDVRRILEILERARNLDHVEITLGDIVLRAGKSPLPAGGQSVAGGGAPAKAPDAPTAAAPEPGSGPAAPAPIPEGFKAVRAPMAGTFYITPGPGEPPFVTEGARVDKGDTLCLVEVMKMFNSIPAPCAGTVRQVVAEHGRPVAMGDLLVVIEPEGTA